MQSPRLDGLTGLRFAAALLVFLHHALSNSIVSGGLADLPVISELARFGFVGVTFFFVLSGFVLAWSWDSRRDKVGFYGRRFARVWPLHAVTLVLAVAIVLPALGRSSGDPLGVLAAVLGVQAWVPDPHVFFAANGPSWSLSCEAFFYAVLPLAVPYVAGRSRRAAVVAILASVAGLAVVPIMVAGLTTGTGLLALWVFPGYRLGEFAIGVVLGFAMRAGWRPSWSVLQAAVLSGLAYCAAVVLLTGVADGDDRSMRAMSNLYGDLLVLLPLAGLIVAVAAADLDGTQGFLRRRSMVLLGEASFAFYLIHSMIILVLDDIGRGRALLAGIPLAAVALGLSVAAAIVLHRAVERPVEARIRARLAAREARRELALEP